MKRLIPVVALGSYYTVNSPAAGPNAHPMRMLVWYVKNNRTGSSRLTDRVEMNHPARPGKTIAEPAHAYRYASHALHEIDAVRGLFPRSATPLLVPIPCSKTTRTTLDERWPARELASRLEKLGDGEMLLALALKKPTEESKGKRYKTASLVGNLDVLRRIPDGRPVVFVDDVVTWGEHLAAAHHVLCRDAAVGAVAVGATHTVTMDAYDVLRLRVEHELRAGAWDVTVTPPPPPVR